MWRLSPASPEESAEKKQNRSQGDPGKKPKAGQRSLPERNKAPARGLCDYRQKLRGYEGLQKARHGGFGTGKPAARNIVEIDVLFERGLLKNRTTKIQVIEKHAGAKQYFSNWKEKQTMDSIKTLGKLMEVSSRDLRFPMRLPQRKLTPSVWQKIVARFNKISPTNRRLAFVTVTIMCLTGNILTNGAQAHEQQQRPADLWCTMA